MSHISLMNIEFFALKIGVSSPNSCRVVGRLPGEAAGCFSFGWITSQICFLESVPSFTQKPQASLLHFYRDK